MHVCSSNDRSPPTTAATDGGRPAGSPCSDRSLSGAAPAGPRRHRRLPRPGRGGPEPGCSDDCRRRVRRSGRQSHPGRGLLRDRFGSGQPSWSSPRSANHRSTGRPGCGRRRPGRRGGGGGAHPPAPGRRRGDRGARLLEPRSDLGPPQRPSAVVAARLDGDEDAVLAGVVPSPSGARRPAPDRSSSATPGRARSSRRSRIGSEVGPGYRRVLAVPLLLVVVFGGLVRPACPCWSCVSVLGPSRCGWSPCSPTCRSSRSTSSPPSAWVWPSITRSSSSAGSARELAAPGRTGLPTSTGRCPELLRTVERLDRHPVSALTVVRSRRCPSPGSFAFAGAGPALVAACDGSNGPPASWPAAGATGRPRASAGIREPATANRSGRAEHRGRLLVPACARRHAILSSSGAVVLVLLVLGSPFLQEAVPGSPTSVSLPPCWGPPASPPSNSGTTSPRTGSTPSPSCWTARGQEGIPPTPKSLATPRLCRTSTASPGSTPHRSLHRRGRGHGGRCDARRVPGSGERSGSGSSRGGPHLRRWRAAGRGHPGGARTSARLRRSGAAGRRLHRGHRRATALGGGDHRRCHLHPAVPDVPGRLLVPLKAIVLNVLSLSATFGAMVWIFQGPPRRRPRRHRHRSDRRRHRSSCSRLPGSPWITVFLLSRIRRYDRTGDNAESIAVGLQRSRSDRDRGCRPHHHVTFLAFSVSGISFIKLFGLGLALPSSARP